MAGKTSTKSAKVANKAGAKRNAAKASKPRQTVPTPPSPEVVLLSGGNPQIAKGHGDAPVRAYIAAKARRRRA